MALCSLKAGSLSPPRRGTNQRASLRRWLIVSAPRSLVRTACSAVNNPANTTGLAVQGGGRTWAREQIYYLPALWPWSGGFTCPSFRPLTCKMGSARRICSLAEGRRQRNRGKRHTLNVHPEYLGRSVCGTFHLWPPSSHRGISHAEAATGSAHDRQQCCLHSEQVVRRGTNEPG